MRKISDDVIISVVLNKEVYKEFKKFCVDQGSSMRDMACSIFSEYMKNFSVKKKKRPVKEIL